VVRRFLGELDRLEIPYVVGGSFASSAWGESRQTNDLDIAVHISAQQGQDLASALAEDFMISGPEILQTLEDRNPYRSFQALHFEEMFKVDVFVPHDTPFVRSEFARARRIELLPNLFVRCSTPEDIVLRKLMWFELGNRVSDRQWNDIVQVLEVQRITLDDGYLAKWAEELGVADLLTEALAQRTDEDPFA
jgi:hypothetical protein